MDATAKFCGACGAPLGRGVKFCGGCGASAINTGTSIKAAGNEHVSRVPPPQQELGEDKHRSQDGISDKEFTVADEVPATDSSPPSGNMKPLQADNSVGSKRRKRGLRWFFLSLLVAVFLVAAWAVTFYLVEEVAPRFVSALAWSPDEKKLVSAGPDNSLQLWDSETGDTLARADLGAIKSVNAVAWSQDGKLIAVADFKQVNFYQLPGLQFIASMPTDSDHPIALCFDPDGSNLYSMSGDFSLTAWDYQQRLRLGGLPGRGELLINSAVFSGDCQRVVTLETAQDGQLLTVYQRLNMETLMTQTFIDYYERVDEVGLNSTGTGVVAVNSETLRGWKVSSGELTGSMDLDFFYINAMAVCTRNIRLAFGGSEGRIRIYDKQGTLLRQLQHGSALGLAVLPLADLF